MLSISRICLLIILISGWQNLNAQLDGFKKIRWEREKIAPGLTWKSSHTLLNDSIAQNINLLIINLRKRKISLVYNPLENMNTSKQAENAGAIAAVNAGFFNISEGGSVTYIKSGGKIVDTDTSGKWIRNVNMSGSLLIDKSGHVFIDQVRTNAWYDGQTEYPEILVTGPHLISAKEKKLLPSTPLVINSHPRTALGNKGNHRIIIITIDGRTDQAKGMTLSELTNLMLSLRCHDAVNLDGGGSTTMWICCKPYEGVVNMPCDNKKFDHAGERAVSDILVIK